MKKSAVIKKIISKLKADADLYHRAALFARAEATHEQNKAENKYDTRGLEASYLARGQSKQAAETQAAIEAFEQLEVRAFKAGEPIELGALVELEKKGERMVYFFGPKAGGTEVVQDGKEIMVITPTSPLGAQMQGKKTGDRVQLAGAGAKDFFVVASVE